MTDTLLDPHITHERTIHPARNAAVVGLIDTDRQILMVRTKRLPNHWQPVGGGVEAQDASPAHTAQRELYEEFGLTIDIDLFKHTVTTNYDFGVGQIDFFTCSLPLSSLLSPNTQEILEWRWISLNKAIDLPVFPATKTFLNALLQ